MNFVGLLIVVFIISMIINEIIKKIAFKIGAYDEPNERRINGVRTPTLGGVSIYISLIIGWIWYPELSLNGLVVGATIIVVIGIIDDIKEISPKIKLLGQLIAIVALFFSNNGLDINYLYFSFFVFWFLLTVNAVNFFDGMDGLASGISFIIILFFILTNPTFLHIGGILLVSIISFLCHNFSRKKLFLGDTGSMLLGFIIAYFMSSVYFQNEIKMYILPFVFLFIIFADVLYVVIDRLLRKFPIWRAEQNHLHHRLMKKGYSAREVLVMIYFMVITTGLVALVFESLIIKL